MSNFGSVMLQVPDIAEAVKQGEITVLPLEPNTKECRQSKWNQKEFSVDFLAQWIGNFGLRVQTFKDDYHLVIIDIDGTLSDKDTKGLTDKDKNASKKLLKNILFKELNNCGMLVDTASTNGGHIYLKVRGTPSEDAHEISKMFSYPWDCGIEGLEGQPLGNALEIFGGNKNRYIVLPGSQINDSIYKIAEESNFSEIMKLPLIEYSSLERRVMNALERNGFEYVKSESEKLESKYDVGFVRANDELESLSSFIIPKFGDFLIPIYKYNDGSKYYMTLAVSGYLSNFIDEQSITSLGEYIIEKEPNLFKNDNHFLKTLTSSYHNDKKEQTGGKTLYEQYSKDVYSPKEFWFKIVYFTNSTVFFYPTGKRGSSYKKIVLNNQEHQVEIENWGSSKKGDYIRSAEPVLGFQILNIRRIRNPIINDAPDTYEMSYIPTGQSKVKTLVGETMKDIEDALKQEVGLILNSQYKTIFNQIIVHFGKINFIDTSVGSSVPGIFEIDGEIRRYNYEKEEVAPSYNKDDLLNAVNLLNDIKDVFPTNKDKLGNICRIGLLLPFYHILKSHGHLAKYLILAQAGGTLKSTISEMIVNFYNPTKTTTKQANIFNGGQFSTPYQVGEKFGISSYPFVVNEPGKALSDPEIIEILKSAIESDVARVTHDGAYYAYGTAIFSTNIDIQQSDAFLRRSNVFYFNNSERASEKDIEKIAKLLNKNKMNDRFTELSAIGDFCFTYLAANKHLFEKMSVEDLELHLVEKIEEITEIDLSWMKEDAKEDVALAIEEIDDEILDTFLQKIKDDYNSVFKIYQMIHLDEEKGTYVPSAFDEQGLVTIITRGACSLLEYDSKSNHIIISGNKIKNFFKKEYNKIVTSTALYEELLPYADLYDVEKGQYRVKRNRVRGIRVETDLIIDLLNNDLREGEEDEE